MKNVLDEMVRIKELINIQKQHMDESPQRKRKLVIILYVSRLGHTGQ